MAIVFNKQDNTFTLHTKNTTYQMKVDQYGVLLHLYYGSRTAGNMDYLLTYTDRGFSGNPHDVGQEMADGEPPVERPGNLLKVSRIYRDARMHPPPPPGR